MRSVRSSQKRVATTQVQASVGISREKDSESTRHTYQLKTEDTTCSSFCDLLHPPMVSMIHSATPAPLCHFSPRPKEGSHISLVLSSAPRPPAALRLSGSASPIRHLSFLFLKMYEKAKQFIGCKPDAFRRKSKRETASFLTYQNTTTKARPLFSGLRGIRLACETEPKHH